MRWVRRYARPAFVVVLLAACGWALVNNWDEVADLLPQIGWTRFLLTTAAATGAGFALAIGWRIVLHDMSHRPIGVNESVAVFSASQLGRYVPGSVWAPLAQLSLGRRRGINSRAIGSAFVVHLVVTLIVAIVVAAASLLWTDSEQLRARWWLLVLVPAVGTLLVPAVNRRVVALVSRIVGRELALATPRVPAMVAAAGACAISFGLFGVHLALLAWPLMDEPGVAAVVQAVGAFALAWAAGLVVVFAPAGLGVREIVLALALSSLLTRDEGAAVAVLSRFSIVIADVALGLFGVVYLSTRRGFTAETQPEFESLHVAGRTDRRRAISAAEVHGDAEIEMPPSKVSPMSASQDPFDALIDDVTRDR